MAASKVPVIEPEVQAMLNAAGLPKMSVITFIKMPKLMFTIDEIDTGLRLIYSQGFLDRLKA